MPCDAPQFDPLRNLATGRSAWFPCRNRVQLIRQGFALPQQANIAAGRIQRALRRLLAQINVWFLPQINQDIAYLAPYPFQWSRLDRVTRLRQRHNITREYMPGAGGPNTLTTFTWPHGLGDAIGIQAMEIAAWHLMQSCWRPAMALGRVVTIENERLSRL